MEPQVPRIPPALPVRHKLNPLPERTHTRYTYYPHQASFYQQLSHQSAFDPSIVLAIHRTGNFSLSEQIKFK